VKRVLAVVLVLLAVAVVGIAVVSRMYGIGGAVPGLSREVMYPPTPVMPAVVSASVEELLGEYEAFLKADVPAMWSALRPGLGDGEIDELEQRHGVKLTEDLRALYRWRDGTSAASTLNAFPDRRFVPLGEALGERDARRKQVNSGSRMERAAHAALAGYRDGWIDVIVDMSGDGYFFDPGRAESAGSFFFCFAEDSSYEFYPKFRNYLASVVEGRRQGIFGAGDFGVETKDFAAAYERVGRYGAVPPR
jgi:cell wall assembly regulator SMI1